MKKRRIVKADLTLVMRRVGGVWWPVELFAEFFEQGLCFCDTPLFV